MNRHAWTVNSFSSCEPCCVTISSSKWRSLGADRWRVTTALFAASPSPALTDKTGSVMARQLWDTRHTCAAPREIPPTLSRLPIARQRRRAPGVILSPQCEKNQSRSPTSETFIESTHFTTVNAGMDPKPRVLRAEDAVRRVRQTTQCANKTRLEISQHRRRPVPLSRVDRAL